MQEILVNIGGILTLLGFLPQGRGSLQGKFPFFRTTMFIWTVEGWILFSLTPSSAPSRKILAALAFGFTGMFVISIFRGESGWDYWDVGVLGGALLSISIWLLLGRKDSGLLVGIATDAIGAIPIIRDVWCNPWRSTRNKTWHLPMWWMFWWTGAIAHIFAQSCFSCSEAWFSVYGIILTSTIVGIIMLKGGKKTVKSL